MQKLRLLIEITEIITGNFDVILTADNELSVTIKAENKSAFGIYDFISANSYSLVFDKNTRKVRNKNQIVVTLKNDKLISEVALLLLNENNLLQVIIGQKRHHVALKGTAKFFNSLSNDFIMISDEDNNEIDTNEFYLNIANKTIKTIKTGDKL